MGLLLFDWIVKVWWLMNMFCVNCYIRSLMWLWYFLVIGLYCLYIVWVIVFILWNKELFMCDLRCFIVNFSVLLDWCIFCKGCLRFLIWVEYKLCSDRMLVNKVIVRYWRKDGWYRSFLLWVNVKVIYLCMCCSVVLEKF